MCSFGGWQHRFSTSVHLTLRQRRDMAGTGLESEPEKRINVF